MLICGVTTDTSNKSLSMQLSGEMKCFIIIIREIWMNKIKQETGLVALYIQFTTHLHPHTPIYAANERKYDSLAFVQLLYFHWRTIKSQLSLIYHNTSYRTSRWKKRSIKHPNQNENNNTINSIHQQLFKSFLFK